MGLGSQVMNCGGSCVRAFADMDKDLIRVSIGRGIQMTGPSAVGMYATICKYATPVFIGMTIISGIGVPTEQDTWDYFKASVCTLVAWKCFEMVEKKIVALGLQLQLAR